MEIALAAFLSLSAAKSQGIVAQARGDLNYDGYPENAWIIKGDSVYNIVVTDGRTNDILQKFHHLPEYVNLRFVRDRRNGNHFIYFTKENKDKNGKIFVKALEIRFDGFYYPVFKEFKEKEYLLMRLNSF